MAYPPWALFPFEVAFMSVLSFRPNFDDALHHRRSAFAYRCNRVRPILCLSTISRGLVRRAPCRVQFLCARDPITRESDVFLVGLHHLAMMPRRLVAIPSTPSMLPSSEPSVSLESPGFVLANGPLIRTPRVVFFRTPSFASTARWSPEVRPPAEAGNVTSRGYHSVDSLRSR